MKEHEKKGIVDIYMKDMFNVWQARHIIEKIAPKLQHENDGLIFTLNSCPYYPGTCEEILKWKPKNLNTVDFQLKLLQERPYFLWGL